MTLQKAGTEVDYTVTYLEMTARPSFDYPRLPIGSSAALLKASDPPVWYFLSLYDAVGRDYAWEDQHSLPKEEVMALLSRSEIFTLIDHGWPHGFFMLQEAGEGIVELAYFGLVPEAVGSGLGNWLLKTAILMGWDRDGTKAMIVDTCTLDHPRALALYQKNGFMPVRRENAKRVLARDRDLSRIPS